MAATNEYRPEIVSHPGQTLEEKLDEMDMTQKELAVRTGKPQETISKVINGKSAITPEMARKFEEVMGIPSRFWLERDRAYQEYLVRKAKEKEYERYSDWMRRFPYKTMADFGWVPKVRAPLKRVEALLEFFRVSTPEAWENVYLERELKLQFRISLKSTRRPESLSAWLRRGELQAQEIEAAPFSVHQLKNILPDLKRIMAQKPNEFFDRIQNAGTKAGVKIIFTPHLPKAPIQGATRWIKNYPVIQLTDRYKRYDSFWFTLFHELGHIILHGKKEVFLEGVNYSDKDEEKEHEANTFAAEWLLSSEEEEIIIRRGEATPSEIKKWAKEFGTHHSVIIGRLQHRGYLSFAEGNKLVENIDLRRNKK